MRRRSLWLIFFALHLVLVLCVCSGETIWLIGHTATILPQRFKSWCQSADRLVSAISARTASNVRPAHQVIQGYLHAAGIESGYGFFAPNVPDSYKIAFTFHFADGRERHISTEPTSLESSLRLASLTDYIGRTESATVREDMLKLLAFAFWQEDPGVIGIQAQLFSLRQPTIEEFHQGRRQAYEESYSYDFSPVLTPLSSGTRGN